MTKRFCALGFQLMFVFFFSCYDLREKSKSKISPCFLNLDLCKYVSSAVCVIMCICVHA